MTNRSEHQQSVHYGASCSAWLVVVLAIQTASLWLPWISLVNVVPLIALFTRTGDPTYDSQRPFRVYLTCLLVGITSVLVEFSELQAAISESLLMDESADPLLIFLDLLPRLGFRTVIPIAAGLFGLIAFMHVDGGDALVDESPDWLLRLDRLLQQSDVPTEVSEYLKTLSGRISRTSKSYREMTERADAANQQLNAISTSCTDVAAAMTSFATVMRKNESQLNEFGRKLTTTHADLGQMESQVMEMGEVLEQFAQVANHRVMQYRPDDHQPKEARRESIR